jgi:acyl-CoA reductase-like NAD-dependent aldehyde dehydrogenase
MDWLLASLLQGARFVEFCREVALVVHGCEALARGALLQRLADVVAREADRLAEIETRDNGKLITDNDPDWARLQARALAARERPEQ